MRRWNWQWLPKNLKRAVVLPEKMERLQRQGEELRQQVEEVRREMTWDRNFALERAARLEETLAQIRYLHEKADLYKNEDQADRERLRVALGRIETRQTAEANFENSEFRVFSQWGEDGLIQALIRCVPIPNRCFVEFGVEDYQEANTRFLLMNGWSGLVLDGNSAYIETIKRDPIYWKYNLKAEAAFITRENINALLESHGLKGEIGLLSVDIDGNDYWVWEAITVISPAIVVIEYNYRFGATRSVVVPYDPAFVREKVHSSRIYFGASLTAICRLGTRKGYDFVGCGSSGINAFFVRSDLRPATLSLQTPEAGFREGCFSEFHNEQGELVKMSHESQSRLLQSLPLIVIEET